LLPIQLLPHINKRRPVPRNPTTTADCIGMMIAPGNY
jgi:hypothetical protein